MRAWLADARCVRSITPMVNGSMVNGRRPSGAKPVRGNGTSGTGRDIDLIVGIFDAPDDPALENCRQLTDAGRLLPFLAVLLTPGRQLLQAALDVGAGGAVAAASGPASLADAVAAVAGGAAWLDPALSHLVMARMAAPISDDFGLTPMQQQVAACFPDGLTNREIGDRLGIGEETVKSHVSNIYRKLDVCDRTSAVALLRGRLSPRQTAATDPEPASVGSR